MKYFKKIITYLFFLILINQANAIENKILIKIDNEIITTLDINNEITYLKIINKNLDNFNKKEAYKIAKDSLIREKIKEIEISKWIKKPVVEEKYLNPIIKNIYTKLNITSLNEFEKSLNEKSISLEEIKKKISIEILWNQLIYSKYSNKLKINKDKIKKEILLNKNTKLIEYELSEIVFNIQNNQKFEKKFNNILEDINNIGFNDAALIHSISSTSKNQGYLGWIKEASLNKKIKNELNNKEKGEFTNPIVIPGGFIILKINNIRKKDKIIDIEKEVNLITKEKTNEQLNQYSNIYFNTIKKDIKIHEL